MIFFSRIQVEYGKGKVESGVFFVADVIVIHGLGPGWGGGGIS